MLKIFQSFFETIGLRAEEEEKESITRSELKKLVYHNPFSRYLLYGYYDKELGVYYNLDDTIGIIFECRPVLFCSKQNLDALKNVLNAIYPEGSVMQFICYADPYVDPVLDLYVLEKTHAPSFVKRAYQSLADYFRDRKESGLHVRRFRVFVTLKFPAKEVDVDRIRELKTGLKEGLIASGLVPFEVPPEVLVSTLRRFFNDNNKKSREEGIASFPEFLNGSLEFDPEELWTPYAPLRKQIIYSDTTIEKKGKVLHVGNKKMKVLSPKTLPAEIDYFFANFLSGSYEGVVGDNAQIESPFMIVVNVVMKDEKMAVHSKANLVLQQQAFGSFVTSLQRKKDEFLWALDALERGEKMFSVIITLIVYDTDERELDSSCYKAMKVWERLGCVMQEESTILLPLFVYSLPFGFVYDKNSLLFLDRHFVVPSQTLAAMLPVQVDFNVWENPALLFVGRKGELVSIDLFSRRNPNYNFAIFAPTGKGKSFTANYIIANYLGRGVKVRIIDIGGSYKKLCNMFGGNFIDFHPDSNICINFFETIKDPQYDIPVVTYILTHMATPQTGELPSQTTPESAVNIMSVAVNAVVKSKGTEATIDDVYEYLANFTKYFDDHDLICAEEKEVCEREFTSIATHLAFNLYKYTSYGSYGKWFNGKTTFDVSKDDFVVLELEHLKPLKDLFNVIVLVVLNAVTSDLYLSSRERPTLILLDEAWQFLQDARAFQEVIEEGYRRARKYYGSFGIITQSVLDIENFGRVGHVINSNASFKFYLESSDFQLAHEKKLLPFDDEFTIKLLSSIRYNAPKYSEIFMYSDRFGAGVLRLCVDPYSYYVYTSDPREISEIESMVRSGMSYEEAIEKMIEKYRKV